MWFPRFDCAMYIRKDRVSDPQGYDRQDGSLWMFLHRDIAVITVLWRDAERAAISSEMDRLELTLLILIYVNVCICISGRRIVLL